MLSLQSILNVLGMKYEEIKRTFDKLGIPEAEQKYLAGVSAQYESEVVYHNMEKIRRKRDNL